MGRYIFQAIDQHSPTKQKRIVKSKQPQWINGDILNQLKFRDNLLSKARKFETNSTNAWKQYHIARNLASNMIEKAKRNYLKSSIQNNKGNVKSIWKLIKSLGDLNNYRPISILSVLSKIIERHIHNCLFYYK
jgi:hypothetical protein